MTAAAIDIGLLLQVLEGDYKEWLYLLNNLD
jgi:hypothetical protein